MTEIARIDLLEEGDREADLSAKQHVPQHDGAEQHTTGLGKERRLTHQEGLDESPQDHLHHRPIAEIEKPRPRTGNQIPMAQDHGANAMQGFRCVDVHDAASRAPWRATSKNTSSSVVRPYLAIRLLGEPVSTIRPWRIIST